MSQTLAPDLQEFIIDMCFDACEPLTADKDYDFAASDLTKRLHEKGMSLSENDAFWHVPPADSVFLHRKLGGVFLLACTLKASINLHSIARDFMR
jgi:hypothetical protein